MMLLYQRFPWLFPVEDVSEIEGGLRAAFLYKEKRDCYSFTTIL